MLLRDQNFRDKLELVFPEEMHDKNLVFFESIVRNLGIQVTLFSDMDEALKWINNNDNMMVS